MDHGGVSQVTYTWWDVLYLVREAKRHKDFELRSAILADICNAVDELDKGNRELDCRCLGLSHRDTCPEWTLPI